MKKTSKKQGLTFPYPSLQTVSHIQSEPQPHSVVKPFTHWWKNNGITVESFPQSVEKSC